MTNKLKFTILTEMQLYEKKIVKQKTKDESSDNESDYSTLNYCQDLHNHYSSSYIINTCSFTDN